MPAFVAFESTVIAHGLPYPQNVKTALRLETIARTAGAEPRTIGIVGGEVIVGLTESQILHLAQAEDVRKVSLRDLPVATAQQLDGATTVAATMHLAHRHGIGVMATGGIGGVHRGARFDVSADLDALARLPMTVVCSGAKAILDLPTTREVLETRGVTVAGYQTDEMPAFYSRSSGLPVDARCETPEDVAALVQARRRLDLSGAVLVTVPVPEDAALPREAVEPAIAQALDEAETLNLRSAEVTPFLLSRLRDLAGDDALWANVALLENNAHIAGLIAKALEAPRGA